MSTSWHSGLRTRTSKKLKSLLSRQRRHDLPQQKSQTTRSPTCPTALGVTPVPVAEG